MRTNPVRTRPAVTAAAAATMMSAAAATVCWAQPTPAQRNDLAFGLNRNNPAETLQLVRGTPVGTRTANEWGVNFVQSVQFDNLDGFRHAHFGNLLGLDFGTTMNGGEIYNFETRFTAGTNPGASQLLFDFPTYNTNNPGAPLSVSRLGGLSVSPYNNRVAATGNDSGAIYVFDYAAGNGTGTGAAVSNGREVISMPAGSTIGTAWLDNDNLVALDANGDLQRITVNNGTLSTTTLTTLTLPGGGAPFTSVAYEPTLSPYVFAAVSRFEGSTSNTLFVLDPNNNYSIVKQVDYSTTINTLREIGFDSRGNLFISHFVNTTSVPPGASIAMIAGAAENVATLETIVPIEYYTQVPVLSAQFNGMDVASTLLDYKTPGVTVDVRDRSHVQYYFGPDPSNEIRQRLQSGYAGGSWNGTGIISSTAAATPGYAVGYGNAADLGLVGVVFGDELVADDAILFRYTRSGDANLDGNVNLNDFNRLAANFGLLNRVWSQGDFNYDGQVNLNDFNLLAANFGLAALGSEVTPQDWANLAAAVPEPTGLSVLAGGALAALGSRRGRRRRCVG